MCGERGKGERALSVCSCVFSVSVSLCVSVSGYVYVSQFARLELIIHNIQSEVCVGRGGGLQRCCWCVFLFVVYVCDCVCVRVWLCVYASQFARLYQHVYTVQGEGACGKRGVERSRVVSVCSCVSVSVSVSVSGYLYVSQFA